MLRVAVRAVRESDYRQTSWTSRTRPASLRAGHPAGWQCGAVPHKNWTKTRGPVRSRFETVDPITPDVGAPATSSYTYASNDPTLRTDPSGREDDPEMGSGGWATPEWDQTVNDIEGVGGKAGGEEARAARAIGATRSLPEHKAWDAIERIKLSPGGRALGERMAEYTDTPEGQRKYGFRGRYNTGRWRAGLSRNRNDGKIYWSIRRTIPNGPNLHADFGEYLGKH